KSSEFGDDVDRAIKKSDGSWTYFAPDIAYHWDKCQRGFDQLIDIFGADHGGYVKRIKSAVSALSDKKVAIDVKLMQMIKLLRGGEPAKMSKRAGNFVLLRDVVEELGEGGKGIFRFIMLTRKNDAPLDFDFEKVLEQSKDNPVFYVQYAHARACSALRNIASEMPEAFELAKKPDPALASQLTHEQEIALIKLLTTWPRIVEQAAAAAEPHRVAFFLQDVAAGFHAFWNAGNDDLGLRFIVKHDIKRTAARAMLAMAVTHVIASGLLVIGVDPLEEMR
ncbi:MAG: DALR anticodon-binding domain-containing protein, partial [Alphaproteobacteria bacterium]